MGKHVPGTGQFVSAEGKEVPDRYDAESGRPIDQKTGELIPIDKKTFRPTDPKTGKVYPGTFDPETGKALDPKTKKPAKEPELPTDNDRNNYVPLRWKQHLTENDPRDHKNPGKFVDDGEPGVNPPQNPDVSDPDAKIPPED